MNVIDWVIQNGILDVNCELFTHTIPLKTVERMVREKPGKYASGCVISLIVPGTTLQFHFETLALAADFRADFRIFWMVKS